jgi:hypothetical protein
MNKLSGRLKEVVLNRQKVLRSSEEIRNVTRNMKKEKRWHECGWGGNMKIDLCERLVGFQYCSPCIDM